DRWMLGWYPPDAELPAQREDGLYGWRGRIPRRVEPLLDQGEERFPRDTAAQAVRLAMEKLQEFIPKAELAGIEKVTDILRPPFERLTTNFVTRFRPAQQP